MDTRNRASGCLFGLAIGDALAAPTEFMRSVYEITDRFGPQGPMEPLGNPARVTDDTQLPKLTGKKYGGRRFSRENLCEPPLRCLHPSL